MALAAGSMRASSFLGAGRRPFAPAVPAPAGRAASLQVVAAWGKLPNVGGGRKWKHIEVNENGKPVAIPMHIKRGDTVQVITGDDKGKVGTITKVIPRKGLVVVEGVNIHTKAIKPKSENEKGQLKQRESALHHSNVMLYSKEKQVRSRVAYKEVEGKKVRYLVKTGEIVD